MKNPQKNSGTKKKKHTILIQYSSLFSLEVFTSKVPENTILPRPSTLQTALICTIIIMSALKTLATFFSMQNKHTVNIVN